MAIHSQISDILKGKIKEDKTEGAVLSILERARAYNLEKYTANKLDEWIKMYKNENNIEALDIIDYIRDELRSESADNTNELAQRHRQAIATAKFGE